MKGRHYWRGWTQRVPDYGLVRKCAFKLHGQGFFVQTQHEQLDDVKVPFTSFGLPLTLGDDACGYHPPRTNPATRVECQSPIVFPTNTYRDSSPVCSVFFFVGEGIAETHLRSGIRSGSSLGREHSDSPGRSGHRLWQKPREAVGYISNESAVR